MDTFAALDFETADRRPDSACAVGVVRVERGRVVARLKRLIRPPRQVFEFTHIHGITWEQVASEGSFAEVWPELLELLEGAAFVAAHNAGFERAVVRACCGAAALPVPELSYRCTVRLARRAFRLFPTKLPDVCRHLGLPLRHHDPLSDAEACANIVLAAGDGSHFLTFLSSSNK